MEFLGFLFLLFLFVGFLVIRAIGSAGSEDRAPEFTIDISTSGQTYREGDPKKESQRCWISPGTPVSVDGFENSDGMVYVGKKLTSINGWGDDPALINPKLSVNRRRASEDTQDLGYWPRYDEIDSQARAAYLKWLADGRRNPVTPLGLVFLFFYGLERRLLFDTRELEDARGEIEVLLEELRQLLAVYGQSGSFTGYASNLIAYVEAAHLGGPSEASAPSEIAEASEVPFSVKVALGRRVVAGEPIPADLALAWVKTHPEIGLRTPARRCPQEFSQLFRLRYEEKTRGGLKLKRNKTNVCLEYQPASSGNPAPPRIRLDDVPDVTRLKSPARKLESIAQGVQDELAAYSRWVGKTDDRGSAAAVGLLPSELMSSHLDGEAKELAQWLATLASDPGGSVVETTALLERWPSSTSGSLTKKEAVGMTEFLAALGLGIEPDVRLGRANPSRVERVVLFQSEDGKDVESSAALESSTLLLQLGVAVAAADGTIDATEEEKMEEHLEQAMGLSPRERVRLRARMRLMLAVPPSFAGLKKAFEGLSESQRRQVGRFALGIAAADGRVDPDEVKTLTRIYKLLGFDANMVHSELHDLATVRDDGPTTVVGRDSKDTGFGIPAAPQPESTSVALDKERIAQIRTETQEVASLLKDIFEGGEEAGDDTPEDLEEEDPGGAPSTDGAVPGLDEQHSSLVLALRGHDEITRAKFEELADGLHLMAAGAVEVINEAAFEACDEPLIEGSDPLEINHYAMQEILS